ncbi:MAG: YlxR family protein [Pseudodesulfovibrio sp.]
MCVVCRQRFPKGELTRHVCPDTMEELETNGPVPDPEKNKPGRGFYICDQTRCRDIFPKMITGLMKQRKGVNR